MATANLTSSDSGRHVSATNQDTETLPHNSFPRTSASASIGGAALVLAATLFNAVLCFISTVVGIHFSSLTVVLCEMLILITGLYLVRSRISEVFIRVVTVMVTMLIAMKFINSGLDLKLLHDLSIPYIFYLLGTLATPRQGNRLLWGIVAIVIALGIFEMSMPVQFGKLFNAWAYYVDKGVLTTTVNYGNSTSFISGVRGGQQARSLFPSLLGPQRASSVFLEPVSMGNFSVIVFAWCLSFRQKAPWKTTVLIVGAAICAILSDLRFAFVCWSLMLLLRCSPLYRSRFLLFCLPLGAMLALLTVGSLHQLPDIPPYIMSDDFPGRLLFSGRLLNYWGWPQWFGFAPSQIYTADTGYAYTINNLGLPLALGLLGLFAAKIPATLEAASMKAMITVYMAASLCIGANMFTIKTAALMWFLYGVANIITVIPKNHTGKSNSLPITMDFLPSSGATEIDCPIRTP